MSQDKERKTEKERKKERRENERKKDKTQRAHWVITEGAGEVKKTSWSRRVLHVAAREFEAHGPPLSKLALGLLLSKKLMLNVHNEQVRGGLLYFI